MNNRNVSTFIKVFERPTRSDVKWKDIEALFIALGAEVSEGRGSRVRVKLSNVLATFHRPHPQPDTDKGAVKSVEKFLVNAGYGADSFKGKGKK